MLDNLKLGGPNRLAQSKPCENGETLNASRRRQYRAKYENLTWKKITQNPNYSINQNGVIRNDNTNQLKQPYVNQNTGYLIVDLWENNRGKKYSVHRLVAETFISNPACKPTVDHIDGDRQNNSVENLRWATYSEQNSRFGTVGVRSEEIVVKHYEERRKNRGGGHIEWLSVSEVLRFSSISEAADYFDCTLGNISQMLKVGTIGRRGLMRGYQFMYQTSRKTHKSVTTIETEQRFA
ncbi:HNH endonuclease [Enterococcus raffinosus]|uniref:HNH endonuclease n=2 Tax=Bacilli TaxID=91061 RepID=A0AAW8T8T5_9ENTE|nr:MULTISPECIES: HNH endonuclease [Lactobacillales]MBA5256239.1 HNH endonuclease [Enterococcus hirae]MDB1684455.1 HNH endonuclease [Enterococcus durans]MDG6143201.1 HNH endonuclease [Lactococcus formosensis]MDT2544250.1 HNH endonuclease [Enterococcus raffinosus]MDT2558313.1 HNH endonuclease [Lactococcus petauri]